MHKGNEYLAAIGTTVGTIIGAGILALPYAISKTGFWYGLLIFLLVGLASVFITLYTAELSFRERRMHQLPVMVGKYLGNKFKLSVLILQMLTIYGAMIAYLVGLGIALVLIFSIPYYIAVLIVFLLTLPLIYEGYDAIEISETPLSVIKILLLLAVSAIILLSLSPRNLNYFNFKNFLEPFGVVLFALTSFTVIPEVKEEVGNDPRKLERAIIISYIISILIYVVFSAAFIGAFGQSVASIATNSITSGTMSLILILTTIFLLITPYLALGLVIVDAFFYDFGLSRMKSLLLGVWIPFFVAIIHPTFEGVLSITGGVFISLLAILILAAVVVGRLKERKRNTYRVAGGISMIIFTGAIMIIGLIWTLTYLYLQVI